MSDSHLALYGGVNMVRARCEPCGGFALVLDGKLLCCGARPDGEPTRVKRMTSPNDERHLPPVSIRRAIVKQQNGCCLYCDKRFGTRVAYHGRWRTVQLNWDHLVPFSFSQDNAWSNYAAVCSICNGWKSNRVFRSIDEVRVHVLDLWAHEEKRGVNEVPTDGTEHAAYERNPRRRRK